MRATLTGFGMRSNVRQVCDKIEEFAGLVEDTAPVARDFGGHMVRSIVERMPRTPRGVPSQPGQPPAQQAGGRGAAGSMTYEILQEGDVLLVGSPLIYMAKQQVGGEIRPRTRRALAVPIHDKARGRRPRDFAGLFKLPAKKGDPDSRGILALRKGKDDVIAMFALRGRVVLPARPWLYVTDQNWEYLHGSFERQWTKEH